MKKFIFVTALVLTSTSCYARTIDHVIHNVQKVKYCDMSVRKGSTAKWNNVDPCKTLSVASAVGLNNVTFEMPYQKLTFVTGLRNLKGELPIQMVSLSGKNGGDMPATGNCLLISKGTRLPSGKISTLDAVGCIGRVKKSGAEFAGVAAFTSLDSSLSYVFR